MQTFYSNGKLLITGEYVVLDGAQAFALPTKYGQNLIVEQGNENLIQWVSHDHDGSVWFEGTIPFESVKRKQRFDEVHNIKNTLIEILHEAYKLNSDFIENSNGFKITTQLTFPKFWGLGTSSTLINNIAQWLRIDAFKLLENSFGGSGYDVACAQNDTPIVYELKDGSPIVTQVQFDPEYKNKIYFVYLNQKQNSRTAIANYYNKQGDIGKIIPVINKITEKVITAETPKEFALELQQHEIELSNILEEMTVKELFFEDFDGVIKSLGAWGGDFVLAIAKENPTAYFHERGYKVVVPYSDMIL